MSKKDLFSIGVDLGGTSIKIGLVSKNGEIIKQICVESKASEGPKSVVKQIVYGIEKLLDGNKKSIAGVGIGAPGCVTLKKGMVENPPNFANWGKVALGSLVKKKLNMDVFVENDANAAAIGELIFGAGKKINNFIMITLGTGFGGGIIFDKKIFRGETGSAGELGHVTINYAGNKCNCGSIGCVEAYTGNNYLINMVKAEISNYKDSKIFGIIENNLDILTPLHIHQAAVLGDNYAVSVIKRMGQHIGYSLVSAINILDISTVIVGGGVAGFGDLLFDEILNTVNERILIPKKGKIKIIPAMYKNNAGIMGASALVYYRL